MSKKERKNSLSLRAFGGCRKRSLTAHTAHARVSGLFQRSGSLQSSAPSSTILMSIWVSVHNPCVFCTLFCVNLFPFLLLRVRRAAVLRTEGRGFFLNLNELTWFSYNLQRHKVVSLIILVQHSAKESEF